MLNNLYRKTTKRNSLRFKSKSLLGGDDFAFFFQIFCMYKIYNEKSKPIKDFSFVARITLLRNILLENFHAASTREKCCCLKEI